MQTIRTALHASCQRYATRVALELGEERMTYEQLMSGVSSAAQRFHCAGITSESMVALLFENSFAAIVGFLALACLGSGVVPLDPILSLYELEAIRSQTPFTTLVGSVPTVTRLGQPLPAVSVVYLDDPSTAFSEESLPEVTIAPDAPFLYHFTSGTTGIPKAALHPQSSLLNGAQIYQRAYTISEMDTVFVPVPLYHSFGMIGGMMTALCSGACLVLSGRFVPTHVVATLSTKCISIMLATPLICDLMARCALSEVPDLSSLRLCLSSGSPLSPETSGRFQQRFGVPVYSVYGCTEVGVIAARRDDQQDCPAQAIGRPMPGVQTRIIDEQGNEVATTQSGLLLVKTPAMFRGYYRHEEASKAVLRDGWYVTGDLASQDEHGYLFLQGRKETFINVGGKKVNPVEVEQVLLSHPLVKEALVFGAQVGGAGEAVQAVVVLESGVAIDELVAFCRTRLAAYKVPTQLQVLPELPKTGLGKVRRGSVQ